MAIIKRLTLLCSCAAALTCAADIVDRTAPAALKTLGFSILEDYDKGDSLEDIARDFALFRELNVTTWRGSLGWDDYEPEAGKYDFTWLHQFLEAAARSRIDVRPYVGYTPSWAAGGEDRDGEAWNQPPRDQSVWTAFVTSLSAELRHHENVRSLEIYNEQNVRQWWEGTVDAYGETLVSARAAAPGLELFAGGIVFPDADWAEDLCDDERVRSAFTVLPVHAYPETWTPAGVTVENYLGEGFRTGFLPAIDRACGAKRIWINETGYATTPGRSENDQAAWWVRAIATFAAEPRVEHIGIYEIKDLAPDKPAIGDAPNYHLGLTTADRRKKLAFSTIKMMVELFGTQPFRSSVLKIGESRGAGELHHAYFVRQDGSALLVIWNRTDDDRVRVQFPRAVQLREYGLDGRQTEHDAQEGVFDIPLQRGLPRVFIVG